MSFPTGSRQRLSHGVVVRANRCIAFVLACILAAVVTVSCGKKGPPVAPEPKGPERPTRIEVRQIGPTVLVGFVAPEPRSEKPAQQIVRAELVRVSYESDLAPPPDSGAFRRRGDLAKVLVGDPLDSGLRLVFVDEDWRGPDGATDRVLRYAVRIRDRNGRSSALVAARDLTTSVVAEPPRDLKGEATSDGIGLTWVAPIVEEGPRFNIYRSDSGAPTGWESVNADPVTTNDYIDRTVDVGSTYVYEVRAQLTETAPHVESASSNRVEVVAEDRFAPAAPTGLVAVQEGDAVRLFWDPNRERDLSGYRVYRKNEAADWVRIGPDVIPEPLFLDVDVLPGDRLFYRVTALDRARQANESAPSVEAEMDVARDTSEDELPEDP